MNLKLLKTIKITILHHNFYFIPLKTASNIATQYRYYLRNFDIKRETPMSPSVHII